MKPVSPHEIVSKETRENIPDDFLQILNELIVKHYDGIWRSAFKEQELIDRLNKKDLNGQDLLDNLWPLINKAYTNAGWKVSYDKLQPNDTYQSLLCFDNVARENCRI